MTIDEVIKHAEEVADYDCYNEKQFKCAEDHRQLAEWLKELKQLRAHVRWIPVSERLPEDSGEYLVWNKPYSGKSYVSIEDIDCDGMIKKWNTIYANEIVAWMPLPQAYKAESEE